MSKRSIRMKRHNFAPAYNPHWIVDGMIRIPGFELAMMSPSDVATAKLHERLHLDFQKNRLSPGAYRDALRQIDNIGVQPSKAAWERINAALAKTTCNVETTK